MFVYAIFKDSDSFVTASTLSVSLITELKLYKIFSSISFIILLIKSMFTFDSFIFLIFSMNFSS